MFEIGLAHGVPEICGLAIFLFNPKSAENTPRLKNAFSNTENVIVKYGKNNLKVTVFLFIVAC